MKRHKDNEQRRCLVVQFNEANFDLIRKYCRKYEFPGLQKLLNLRLFTTVSETEYEHLEPWIQWYSFYSQQSYAEHGVFHLGDCLKTQSVSVFDEIAERGMRVGLFGAMNHHPNPGFSIFIPDAWTEAREDGSFSSRHVAKAIRSIVNKNARLGIGVSEGVGLALLLGSPLTRRWCRETLGLAVDFCRRDRTRLASRFDELFLRYALRRLWKEDLSLAVVFLNGLAHVQHHSMLSSEFLQDHRGKLQSEHGARGAARDEILVALQTYDRMFWDLFESHEQSQLELWIVTGLTQVPCPQPIAYWRFRDHKAVLKRLLPTLRAVYPRMTRDFEIAFSTAEEAAEAAAVLEDSRWNADTDSGEAFGYVQVTGSRVFASFVYAGTTDRVSLGVGENRIGLEGQLDFVAWKNGIHSGGGWGATNSEKVGAVGDVYNIKDVGGLIVGLTSDKSSNLAATVGSAPVVETGGAVEY